MSKIIEYLYNIDLDIDWTAVFCFIIFIIYCIIVPPLPKKVPEAIAIPPISLPKDWALSNDIDDFFFEILKFSYTSSDKVPNVTSNVTSDIILTSLLIIVILGIITCIYFLLSYDYIETTNNVLPNDPQDSLEDRLESSYREFLIFYNNIKFSIRNSLEYKEFLIFYNDIKFSIRNLKDYIYSRFR